MSEYTAIVTREGKWWMVRIPEIDGLTQSRRLDEAGKMARELIAVTLDMPMSQVDVTVSVADVEGVDVTTALQKIESEKAEAEAARDRVATDTRELAMALASRKVPVRDIGAILGVSHQRAHQLVS